MHTPRAHNIPHSTHGHHTGSTSAHASDAIQWLARVGYSARGIVYLLLGGLMLWSLFYAGGASNDPLGALSTLVEAPFGIVLLYLVALGLFAFAIWRLVQAVRDIDHCGSDGKGLTKRGGMVISGLIHLSLGWSTIMMANSSGSAQGGSSAESWSATLMQQSWGRWLLGLIGLAIIGVGITQALKGYKAKFMRHLDVSQAELGKLYGMCRLGLIARSVVFVIVGGLAVQAAIQVDPQQAGGMSDAFRTILAQPFGRFLLGVAAAGMIAFSGYCFVLARYRDVQR